MSRRLGVALIAIALLAAAAAPVLAPRAMDAHIARLLNAPPTVPHIAGADGASHAPFIYRWRLVSQLEQRYEEDRSARVPLVWFTGGHLVQSSDEDAAPLLLLGADSYGRDVFTRLLFGARTSLGLAVASALGAMLVGASLGAIAGSRAV
jgi:peptide/nickel transport system permease protein